MQVEEVFCAGLILTVALQGWYQSIMPGHEPPFCEFEDADADATSGTPTAAWGVNAAKAARSAAVGVPFPGTQMNHSSVHCMFFSFDFRSRLCAVL